MTLFGDQAQSGLDRAAELVEETIEALGVEPTQARLSAEGGQRRWSLQRGSAAILIALAPPAAASRDGSIRVIARVVRLPSDDRQLAFFRRLLELNGSELSGVAFGIHGGEVVLIAERSVRDLDASEVDSMVRTIGRAADQYDDVLAKEYGTSRSSD